MQFCQELPLYLRSFRSASRRGSIQMEIAMPTKQLLAETVIPFAIQRMICTGCGAEANASCNCNVAYIPAAKRVAEYDKVNPGRSTRQAAADLGIDQSRVVRARQQGDAPASPVTGRDGKTYPAKRPPQSPEEMPTQEEADAEHQQTLLHHARLIVDEEMSGETRQKFFAYLRGKYNHVYAQSPAQRGDKGLPA
jgi:hypothetical protein